MRISYRVLCFAATAAAATLVTPAVAGARGFLPELAGIAATTVRSERVRRPQPNPAPTTFSTGQISERRPDFFSTRPGGGGTITYYPSVGTYVIEESSARYPGETLIFSRDEKSAAQSSAAYSVYNDKTTGAVFRKLNAGSGNPLIALTYVTFGTWSRPVPPSPGNVTATRHGYAIYGTATPVGSVPRTGAANYRAIIDGIYTSNTDYHLTGDAAFAMNFGQGSLTFSMTPVGTNSAGAVINFGTLSGTGSISATAATFNGSTPAGGNYSASVSGGFFGPNAEEIGGTFFLDGYPPRGVGGSGIGAFVGTR